MIIARRCLKNWVAVLLFLRHTSQVELTYGSINLHFRDGTAIEKVNDAHLALSLLRYYHYSKLFGSYSLGDLLILRSVGEEIAKRLASNFTVNEIEKGSAGGAFSLKEVLLFTLIRKYRPDVIVETGVAQGVSSYTILAALNANTKGRLISIDLPNRNPAGYKYADETIDDLVYIPEGLAPGWLVPEHLRNRWILELGKSEEILPTIRSNVDIFFHDSEHSYKNMTFEFEWARTHLSSGGLLVSDDISWNSSFDDFLREHSDMKPLLIDKSLGVAIKS